jgi:prepilin-type N-terminal cleavage/methylation domain-containing protein
MGVMRKEESELRRRQRSKGFTSIELIIVIIILSILAGTIIIKNPFSAGDYSNVAADQLIADIQYTQMKAMGVGSTQSITFYPGTSSAREYTIQGESEVRKFPSDRYGNIVVTGTNFGNTLYFNSLGEPCLSYSAGNCTGSCNSTAGCTIGLGVGATASRTVKVYAITGKVQ